MKTWILVLTFLTASAQADELVLAKGVSRLVRLNFDLGAFHVDSQLEALKLGFRKVQKKDGRVNTIFFLPKHDTAMELKLFDKEGKLRRTYSVSVSAPTKDVLARQKAEEAKDGIEVRELELEGARTIEIPFDIGSVFLSDPTLVAYDRLGAPGKPARRIQLVGVKEGNTDFSIADTSVDHAVKYYIRVKGN